MLQGYAEDHLASLLATWVGGGLQVGFLARGVG